MTELRRVRIFDTSEYEAKVDAVGGALIGIDYAHHEIHEADGFSCIAVDTSMANNDTLVLAWSVPAVDPKRFHMMFEWASKASAHVELIEDATWDHNTGSQAPVYNHHRETASSSVVEEDSTGAFAANNALVLNPTTFSAAAGTVLESDYAWTSQSQKGNKSRGDNEWILADDTLYGLRLTADAATNAGWIKLFWYEHTDSN
jgi:hypothetical protein